MVGFAVVQILISLLDLVGVAFIGVLGSLTITGVQSAQPGNRVQMFLGYLGISNFSLQIQSAILGLIAVSLFILRSILSIVFSRKSLYFVSNQGAKLSSKLFRNLMHRDLLFLQSKSTHEYIQLVTSGANAITIGILGAIGNIFADSVLIVVIGIGLFAIDPVVAIETIFLFGSVAYGLYKFLHIKASKLGTDQFRLTSEDNEKIFQALVSFRENYVRNTRDYFSKEHERYRNELASIHAISTSMPNTTKFLIEITLIAGSFIIATFQFVRFDASHAIATLTIFFAAGARIAPAVIRIQSGLLQLKTNIGVATPTLNLIESIFESPNANNMFENENGTRSHFIPTLEVQNLNFCYEPGGSKTITNVSIEIKAGQHVAIVGSSGAGKTTLVDLMLGLLQPDTGDVLISGSNPNPAISKWPGLIAYVPQDVMILNGSIRENVVFGLSENVISDSDVRNALRTAELEEFVDNLPGGLDTQLGERGARLSGGQRQRIGIARALVTNPRLIFLDEATSSLDGQTESDISESMLRIKGETTVVLIAHRLSTVKNADSIVYMKDGKIVSVGTFSEVRSSVEDFDKQARLAGY